MNDCKVFEIKLLIIIKSRLQGEFPCKKDGNFTPGHEFVGIVQEIGPEVKNVKVGARVAADPNIGCNKCAVCRNGNYHFCSGGGACNILGINKNGGWATHCLVPEAQVSFRFKKKLEIIIKKKNINIQNRFSCCPMMCQWQLQLL